MRAVIGIFGILAALVLAVAGWGYWNARADPIVRRADLALPNWPAKAAAIRVVLISDVHLGNATMDAPRLSRIVGQINGLHPDLVLMAGDFVAGDDPVAALRSAKALSAPLARLRSPLGTVATLGNHDDITRPAAIRFALERAGVTVLQNDAVRRGPLVIGGAGDFPTGRQDIAKTLVAMDRLKGARLLFTHSPRLGAMPPADVTLVLAGHTHCGQIVLPGIGPVREVVPSAFLCGLVRGGGRTTIVTGGLGTSVLPFRFGAPPDLWLLTIGP